MDKRHVGAHQWSLDGRSTNPDDPGHHSCVQRKVYPMQMPTMRGESLQLCAPALGDQPPGVISSAALVLLQFRWRLFLVPSSPG